ncbi:MAG: DUF2400 domain-containing protein [Bacteroidota bacterium]|nr:DUF2400 domain-containing protein [Bacteroidota bacterium]
MPFRAGGLPPTRPAERRGRGGGSTGPIIFRARPSASSQAAGEFTANLRLPDPTDPVEYDFELFGAGVGK